LSFRGRLASPMSTLLAGKVTCVTFVTIGEMTKWAELRDWGMRNRQRLDLWLSHQVQLGYEIAVAQTWAGWRLRASGAAEPHQSMTPGSRLAVWPRVYR
jgi:hypothetical protein